MSKLRNILKFLLFLEDNPKHRVLGASSWMAVAVMYAPLLLSWACFAFLLPHGLLALILGMSCIPIVQLEALHVVCDR